MPEHLVTFPPGTSAKLIEEGKMVVSAAPKIEIPTKPEFRGVERAKELFGEDFLGEEAIHRMEESCKAKGINVKFEIPITEFQYSESDLERAKQDEEEDKSRMVVLRPEWMRIKVKKAFGREEEIRQPVNILNLRNLFKKEEKGNITYDNNPFGDGPVFWALTWYNDQEFAKEHLKGGYSMPTKEVLPDSWDKNWEDQNELLGDGERRREAVEAVWDLLLSYAVTGQKHLTQKADWTNSLTSDQGRVLVNWDSGGLLVLYWDPGDPHPYIGVCSSR